VTTNVISNNNNIARSVVLSKIRSCSSTVQVRLCPK